MLEIDIKKILIQVLLVVLIIHQREDFNPSMYGDSDSGFNISHNICFEDEKDDKIKLQKKLKPIYNKYEGIINHYEANPKFDVITKGRGLENKGNMLDEFIISSSIVSYRSIN